MTTIRLQPDELDLIARMIDKRDSAHLSGHTTDPFRVVELNGGTSVLSYPGRTGADNIPTRTIYRLRNLDLFQVFSHEKNVLVFDLADDIRDRLEQLRHEAGQPSPLTQELMARARAEDQQSKLETSIQRASRAREARRQAFADRIGRWVKRVAIVVIIGIYAAASIIVAIFTTPAIAGIAATGILAIIAILSWVFHLDAYAAVRALERRVAKAVEGWLDNFEAREPEDP